MIIYLTGFEFKSFKDKDTQREVCYYDIDGIEPESSHKNSNRVGFINRTFRLSRVHPDDLCINALYEVNFDIRQTNQGYTAKARSLRPLNSDELADFSGALPF